jgi:dUTP pyrophosphatase
MEATPVLCFMRQPGYDDVEFPAYQTPGSAGMDVRAAEDLILAPGETRLVATGFSMSLSEGYEAQMRPRSGLAIKNGITLMNSPGTIDHDYRGHVQVILTNLGREPFAVNKGDRIAQMVIAKVERPVIKIVEQLDETARGAGGFGSTGGG